MKPRKKLLPGQTPKSILRSTGLVGAYLDRADLRGKDLSHVNMTGASLRGADLSDANLAGSILISADLSRACLYRANLEGAVCDSADLSMSYAKSTSFKDARMRFCSFRGGCYKNSFFWGTNLWGSDFRGFFGLGTVFDGANLTNVKNLHHALFFWYRHPVFGGGPIYEPREGFVKLHRSVIPGYSFQENAGFGRVR